MKTGELIFQDPTDKRNFLSRLAEILKGTETRCYAWALIPNITFSPVVKNRQCPGSYSNEKVVDRSCTVVQSPAPTLRAFISLRGVGSPSRRQNRYKSIICDEDAYFTELVRYIHLNPLRAKLVKNFAQICKNQNVSIDPFSLDLPLTAVLPCLP